MPQNNRIVSDEHQPAAYPQDPGARSLFRYINSKPEAAVFAGDIISRTGNVPDMDLSVQTVNQSSAHRHSVIAERGWAELDRTVIRPEELDH